MAKLSRPVDNHDHMQGPADAPLTLVEYGDYECPYCGEAYVIVKNVQNKLGDSLRFVFRNFPLSEMHPRALPAAQAAEAAAIQGKFWEMHDLLYEHQDALEDQDLRRYAQALNLDLQKFTRDFSSEDVTGKIQEDFDGGLRSGVNGTPTFYINGARLDASFEYPVLLAALERQLAPRSQARSKTSQRSIPEEEAPRKTLLKRK